MRNVGSFDWSETMVDRLKSLWSEGLSASTIARRIGCPSRSAVIGKLHRLGCSRPLNGSKPRATTPRSRKRAPVGTITKARYLHGTTAPSAPLPAPAVDDVPRVAFADLEPWHCRYPVGDPQAQNFGFCGLNRSVGTSYCPGHLHRCTGHAEPRNRQSVPQVQQTKELAEA